MVNVVAALNFSTVLVFFNFVLLLLLLFASLLNMAFVIYA